MKVPPIIYAGLSTPFKNRVIKNSLSHADVIRIVAEYYQINPSDLLRKTRKREFMFPRQMAHTLYYQFTKRSLEYIGKVIGNKDHATVLNSIRTVNNLRDTDKTIARDYENLTNKILKIKK